MVADCWQDLVMAVSRADRRMERTERAKQEFGGDSEAVLDLLELTEFAWHDCYREVTPPEQVIDDIFVVARGNLRDFIYASRLAVTDFRDLRMQADRTRS
jgi:hypothetical protein